VEKVERIIQLLDYVAKDLPDTLSNCNEANLLLLNVGSFAIYTAVFGELKSRIAERSVDSSRYYQNRQRIDSVIYSRIRFIESEVDDGRES